MGVSCVLTHTQPLFSEGKEGFSDRYVWYQCMTSQSPTASPPSAPRARANKEKIIVERVGNRSWVKKKRGVSSQKGHCALQYAPLPKTTVQEKARW